MPWKENDATWGTAGKSLAELVIVAAILGVVAAMAVPAYKSFHIGLQGRTAAAEIASTLRMARYLAMARRERLLIRFDLSEHTDYASPGGCRRRLECLWLCGKRDRH